MSEFCVVLTKCLFFYFIMGLLCYFDEIFAMQRIVNCCKSFLYSRFYHNTMWKSTSQNSPSLKRIYPLYHLNVQCFRWWKTSVKSKQIAFLERVIRRGIIALVLKNSEQCSKDPIHLLLPHPRTNEKIIVVIVAIIAISKIDIGPRNSITFVNTFKQWLPTPRKQFTKSCLEPIIHRRRRRNE